MRIISERVARGESVTPAAAQKRNNSSKTEALKRRARSMFSSTDSLGAPEPDASVSDLREGAESLERDNSVRTVEEVEGYQAQGRKSTTDIVKEKAGLGWNLAMESKRKLAEIVNPVRKIIQVRF